MLEYCVNDVELNVKVYNALKFESKGFTAQSVRLEHGVAKIINDQRENGFVIDQRLATTLVAQFEEKLADIIYQVQEVFKPKVTVQILKAQFTKSGALSKLAKDQDGKGIRLTEEEFNALTLKPNSPIKRETRVEFNLGSRKQIGEYLSLIHI